MVTPSNRPFAVAINSILLLEKEEKKEEQQEDEELKKTKSSLPSETTCRLGSSRFC